jgi:hypothetical protein
MPDTDAKPTDALAKSKADYVALVSKATLGAVPIVGSLLSELAGTIIPNQRIDRLTKFAKELEQRLGKIEEAAFRSHLMSEDFTDLLEEGLHQAARSTSDDRRHHIAGVIANSITSEDISFIESKHLLRVLGEINDIEVIWLRSYLNTRPGRDEDFQEKHKDILASVRVPLGSPQAVVDKDTLQISYKEHLCQLDLLRQRHEIDSNTQLPVFDKRSGHPKVSGYEITRLGRFLLRQIEFENEAATS